MPYFAKSHEMQPVFGLAREKNNQLYYKEYMNDKGIFHFHSQIELYFIDDGEMEVVVNNHKQLLRKGQMSVALSYDAHAYKTPEYSRSSVLIIPSFMCKDFLDVVKNKKIMSPFVFDTNTVAIIKEYVAELIKPDTNSIKLSGYIHIILGIILDTLSFENSHKPADTDLASQILFFINANYKNEIALRDVAVHFGYSESYISRYFRDSFNIGFNQYLNILRLKNALQLMNEKHYSITYCATESGFGSMRTFYRVFADEFGCSPKEYMGKVKT